MNISTYTHLLRVLALGSLALWTGTGCVATMGNTATAREASRREDDALVNERMRRLEGDVESLHMQIDRLSEDLRRVQANAANSADAQSASLQSALTGVETRIQNLEALRETDRRQIVDKLSQEIAKQLNALAPPPTRSDTPAAGGYGVEHIVQPGETLSRIAQAYGKTVNAILKANNLKNADTLTIGQKLFIPD